MTADKPSALVPKLRFAEFVSEPPWDCPPLKKLAKRITQRNTHGANLRVLTNSAEHGVVDQREYFDRDIATNTDNYFIVETGDYVYNPRSSSAAPVGPISKNQIGTGVMSPVYTVFRFRNDAKDFFAHYFRSSHWHGYLRRVSNSGARHDRMAITNDDLMQMPIPTPTSREQQKIADCLGSLDDLITAERRKLEALRQHKQGLMQQLFPQPGETVPRLRFPEFLNGSPWDEKTIGDVCDLRAGDFVAASEIAEHADDGSFPCYGGNGFRGYVKSFTHEGRYVLVGRQGALCGNVKLYAGKFHATEHALVAKPNRGVDTGWLFYALDVLKLNRFSIGQAQPGLSVRVLKDVGISVPIGSDEQKKIADCLGLLDDLIAEEIRKLKALRQDKEGLMQKLFPSLEEESR